MTNQLSLTQLPGVHHRNLWQRHLWDAGIDFPVRDKIWKLVRGPTTNQFYWRILRVVHPNEHLSIK